MSKSIATSTVNAIKTRIYFVRGQQVMMDRDLAELYQVETRVLKQAVKRNQKRFPHDFMFILNESEISALVSQSVIPSRQILGGAKPYAFTEQGVASLSGILTSDLAIDIHVQIMRAFVYMRRVIKNNALLFQRVEHLEKQQLITATKLEQIFKAIEDKSIKPQTGIFFDGQVFDAYRFVCGLIRSAKKSLILIDNYIDESVLTLLSKRAAKVSATIYTKAVPKQLALDIKKHNEQYPVIEVKNLDNTHDRFLIIDEKELYHIGASLKDLGKKWFAFSKLELETVEVLKKLAAIKSKIE
jgi:hypothetical protein